MLTSDALTEKLHNFAMVKQGHMVFTQTDNKGLFLMDRSLTFGEPDPPKLGSTVTFNLGGIWTQPVQLDHLNFQCKLYDALAYNEDFTDKQEIMPGQWTYALPFEIPKVAPETSYFVTISGID